MSLVDLLVDFLWCRDRQGFRPASDEEAKPATDEFDHPWMGRMKAEPSILQMATRGERIVRAGGELVPTRPLRVDVLFWLFAQVENSEDLCKFACAHGPLTAQGKDENEGEDVAPLLRAAEMMRAVLHAHRRSDLAELRKLLGQGLPVATVGMPVRVALAIEKGAKAPRLQLQCPDLLTGLWLQVALLLSSGGALRLCDLCGKPFIAGGGGGKRSDSQFCDPTHRRAFNNAKRDRRKS